MRRAISGLVLTLLLVGFLTLAFNIQDTISTFENLGRKPSLKAVSSLSSYENVTIHEGDLIINGTQRFVVENCTYIQRGNIRVSDYAEMDVCNSILGMDQDYWHQFGISVESQARLGIVNSSADAPKGFGLSCLGYSNININHSSLNEMALFPSGGATVIVDNCTFGSAVLHDDCTVVLLSSSFNTITLSDFHGTIQELRPGYVGYFRLRQNQTAISVGYDLTLENSSVNNWDLHVNYDADALLSDSTIGTIWIWYSQTVVKIYGLHSGYFENFDIHNITLRKTSVSNIMLAIVDSVSAELVDTKVQLHLFGQSDYISLLDSDAEVFFALSSSATLFFDRSGLIGGGIADSQLYIYGNVTQIEWHGDWFSSSITRNYAVVVRDIANNSLENVELTMFSRDNVVLWNGFSDSLGTIGFNITFTDNNYTDTLRLEATKEGMFATENVSFLSDTPIIMETRTIYQGDINVDFAVDIYDAILLANAYNSRPGSANWNPNADINNDSIVDIYDAIILAGNYGKTS